MQHDHILKKLNFDLLTPSQGSGGGGREWKGGVGGSAGKIFGTMLHYFVILFNMTCNMTMF